MNLPNIIPVAATLECRVHGGPRPCFACKTAKQPKKTRFLGTPRKGWVPSLPSTKPPILPVSWRGDEKPENRRPQQKKFWTDCGPKVPGAEWMRAIDARLEAAGMSGAEVERAAGLPAKTLTRVRKGRQSAGPALRAKVEAAIGRVRP